MSKKNRNSKLHMAAGGTAVLASVLLSLISFHRWDHGGVLWVLIVTAAYNALFLCFKLTNVSNRKKNQMILAGNFLLFNLFLIYTDGFSNNAYLPVFVFTVTMVTAYYGAGWGLLTMPLCTLLSLQKVLNSEIEWSFLKLHIGIYGGAFFIGNIITYYSTIKKRKKQQKFNDSGTETTLRQYESISKSVKAVIESMPPIKNEIPDGLTGLLSYSAFYKRTGELAQKCLQNNESFFLLMIDIDHFRWFNQKYGYPMGDRILAEIGRMIKRAVGDQGFAGRHGGEEFIVILKDVDYEKAGTLADQLRMKIKGVAELMEELDNQDVELSVSIGMACFPDVSNDINSLVSIAELKMNKGKELGGDRVTA